MKFTNSSLRYWLKQSLIVTVIIGLGIAVSFSLKRANPSSNSDINSNTSHFDNFSQMYARFRMSSTTPEKPTPGDFVLALPAQHKALADRLNALNVPATLVTSDWSGMHKSRSYQQGMTLQEGLASHTEQEGFQLIWDLDQDFIIKDRFATQGTLLESARIIRSSIQQNFEKPIHILTCEGQRAIVLTVVDIKSLSGYCTVPE